MFKADFISLIKRMDKMIRTRSTGTPEDFAARLCLSERSLYNYISLMKGLGAPIIYSRSCGSYIYTIEGEFKFEFETIAEQSGAIR